MTFIDEFLDMMPHEVIIHHNAGWSKSGDPQPGPDQIVKGYVEGKSVKVVDKEGTERVASHIFYAGEFLTNLELEATVTLPVGFNPRSKLHILSVSQYADETGAQFSVLYLKG